MVGGRCTADRRRIGGIDQMGDRVAHPVGVAQALAIRVGMPHRLDLALDSSRGVEAQGGHVVAAEDVQDLAQRHAAAGGRGRGVDVVSAIGAGQRTQRAHLVGREVAHRQQPARLAAGRDDGTRRRPLVERTRAMLADRGQGARQIRLHQAVAGFPG